ncbi:DNA/RNA helicase domain-containing protein [Nonomuraea sp. NPDC049637]|uniref:DNA/RNA helicase domain-containing protein n=1 Tax=Nonomuraea sp. NPDC049637 TaxID=3154356 RepID=UPI00343AF9E4
MLVEYQMPLTSRRADVVLAGINPNTGRDQLVVVELKQWTQATVCGEDQSVVQVAGTGNRPKLHPVIQARGYCEYLADFLSAVNGQSGAVHGVVYLYNATDSEILDLYAIEDDRVQLFSKSRRLQFLDYLRTQFASVPGKPAAERLLRSPVRASKSLLKVARAEIRNRGQFVLIDRQRLAYELVLQAVREAMNSDRKKVVVISGGPGSGKSVIALSLLAELSSQGYRTLHATGSKAFTEVMRRVVAKGSAQTKSMFTYFNNFMTAKPNEIDVLLCDEAHRIRETSANRFSRSAERTGRLQLDELIAAARVPVFLLDEHQAVRPGETGTVHRIRERASALGLAVQQVDLDAQFRFGGSDAYTEWVLRLLGLDKEELAPRLWSGGDSFTVTAAQSPYELESLLRAKLAEGFSARMTAGFCWEWSAPVGDTLVADVRIGDWARPWTVKGDRPIGDAPASALWAALPGGFDQVGTVYTAQGFEYDWNGVIFGPDLVYREGRLVTVPAASRDPAIRSIGGAHADRLIRNTYRVLLTRAMVGTVIYSTDPETQAYFTSLIAASR